MTKSTPKLPAGSLYTRTLELLKGREDVTLLAIHKETGVGFFWLKTFLGGRIPNPSVNNVQAIYEFLSKKKLDV